MPSIFASVPGRAIRMPTSYSSTYVAIRFEKPFDYRTLGCVIVEASISQQGKIQVLGSVSDLVNIDTFGDDPAIITINGIAFLDTCDLGGTSGVDKFLQYYRTNRLAANKTPIVVLFGNERFNGFLVTSSLRIADPEIGIANFSMQLLALGT